MEACAACNPFTSYFPMKFKPLCSRTTSMITTTSSSPSSPRPLGHLRTRKPSTTFLTHCYPERRLNSSNPHEPPPPLNSAQDFGCQKPPLPVGDPGFNAGKVLDVGPQHSWDAGEVGSPVVKRYLSDDKQRWFMWYHGVAASAQGEATGSHSIGLAISEDGIHWQRGPGPVSTSDGVGQVMRHNADWWAFDTESVHPSDVLIMSSSKLEARTTPVYWLYYTGFTPEKISLLPNTTISMSLPGLALSQDGRHWARIEGEHHTGALFDVGTAGEWDSLFIASPKVVSHGVNDHRMYYHSFNPRLQQYEIGVARSRDGIKWVKLGKVLEAGERGSFDEAGVRKGHVVRSKKKDEGYLMAYEGVGSDGRVGIGMATSVDGLKDWRRFGDGGEVVGVGEGGWDGEGVGDPCLVEMDDGEEWRLYYSGIGRDGRMAVGLAVSHGDGLRSFSTRTTSF